MILMFLALCFGELAEAPLASPIEDLPQGKVPRQSAQLQLVSGDDESVLRCLTCFQMEEGEAEESATIHSYHLQVMDAAFPSGVAALEWFPVEAAGSIDLPEGCVVGRRFAVLWSEQVGLSSPVTESCTASVELVAGVVVTGRVEGAEVPDQIVATLYECSQLPFGGEWVGGLPLAVAPDGVLSGLLPPGCWDLTFGDGASVLYTLPQRQLQQGTVADFGTLQLQSGPAVLVRVLRPTGSPVAGLPVELVAAPLAGAELMPSAPVPARSKLPLSTGPDGWVRFSSIEEGQYRLRMNPFDNELPYHSPAFYLRSGAELLLSEVVLPEPSSLSVVIEPLELDEDLLRLDPELTVHFDPITREGGVDGATVLAHRGTLRWSEAVELGPLPPGRMVVEASISRPEAGTALLFARESLELASGEHRWLSLDGRGAFFPGRIIQGDDSEDTAVGVRARLSWRPVGVEPEPDNRSWAETYSDEDGRFVVGLAAPGMYRVEVHLATDGGAIDLGEVRIEDPADTMMLRLPLGQIRGRVVAADGEPVAGAKVFTRRKATRSLVAEAVVEDVLRSDVSGADGRFDLLGVPVGTFRLTALLGFEEEGQGLRLSASENVEITTEQGLVEEIVLRFEAQRQISGRLLFSDGRPATGTFRAIFRAPDEAPHLYLPVRAAADGSFEFQLPESQKGAVDLDLRFPGLPIVLHRLRGDDVWEPLEIRLPIQGAMVEIQGLADGNLLSAWRLVTGGGAHLPLFDALAGSRSRSEGEESSRLYLAPGRWLLVEPNTGRREVLDLVANEKMMMPLEPTVLREQRR